MPGIEIIRDADHPWEDVSAEWLAQQEFAGTGLKFKRLLPTASGRANMQRTRYNPLHHEAPHSHPEDEVMMVLDGALFLGREELGAGDAIFIPRDTTYSLRTDQRGADFVRIGFSDLAPPAP